MKYKILFLGLVMLLMLSSMVAANTVTITGTNDVEVTVNEPVSTHGPVIPYKAFVAIRYNNLNEHNIMHRAHVAEVWINNGFSIVLAE